MYIFIKISLPDSGNELSDPCQMHPIIFGLSLYVFVFLSASNCSPNIFNFIFCVCGDCNKSKRFTLICISK